LIKRNKKGELGTAAVLLVTMVIVSLSSLFIFDPLDIKEHITGFAAGGDQYSISEDRTPGCGEYVNTSLNFTSDMNCSSEKALIINGSDIIIDCNGYSINGLNIDGDENFTNYTINENGTGIYNYGFDNVIIRNCNIKHFGKGIYFNVSSNNIFSNINISFIDISKNASRNETKVLNDLTIINFTGIDVNLSSGYNLNNISIIPIKGTGFNETGINSTGIAFNETGLNLSSSVRGKGINFYKGSSLVFNNITIIDFADGIGIDIYNSSSISLDNVNITNIINGTGINYNNGSSITFNNINIADLLDGNAINFYGCTSLDFANISIDNINGDGIRGNYSDGNITINDSTILNTIIGINLDNIDSPGARILYDENARYFVTWILNSNVSNNSKYGIMISHADYIWIEDSEINDNGEKGIFLDNMIIKTNESYIQNSNIKRNNQSGSFGIDIRAKIEEDCWCNQTDNPEDSCPIQYDIGYGHGPGYEEICNDPKLIVRYNDHSITDNGKYGIRIIDSDGGPDKNIIVHDNYVDNHELYGIMLNNTNNTYVHDNLVYNSGLYDVYLLNSYNNSIHRNIADTEKGFFLNGSDYNELFHDFTENNTKYGFHLYDSHHNWLHNCTANNNTLYGFYLEDSYYNLLSDITALNNAVMGIYFDNSGDNNISVCTVKNNDPYGIYLNYSHDNIISTCYIENSTDVGILLEYSTNNSVFNNTVTEDVYGIKLDLGSHQNGFMDNLIKNASGMDVLINISNDNLLATNTIKFSPVGVNITNSNSTLILDKNVSEGGNKIIYNTKYGVFAENAYATVIDGNSISNNEEGLWFKTNVLYSQVRSNNIENNTNFGIYLNNSGNNSIKNNNISYNGDYGVYSNYSNYIDILDNNILSNNIDGIYFKNSSYSNVNSNIIENSINGIYLNLYSDNNAISKNTVENCDYSGVYLEQSSYTLVYDNKIKNVSKGIYSDINSIQNNMTQNNVSNNNETGIYILDGSNSYVAYNTVKYIANDGIYLNGTNIIVTANSVENSNGSGISISSNSSNITGNYLYYNDYGITFYDSENNNLIRNGIENNNYGIKSVNSFSNNLVANNIKYNTNYAVYFSNSDDNILTTNYITNSSIGVNLTNSDNNLIYNNYFAGLTVDAEDDGNNEWNTTYNCSGRINIVLGRCIGGNYWENYTGEDNGNGVYPHNVTFDDIADEPIPYNGSTGNTNVRDYMPLIRRLSYVFAGDESYYTQTKYIYGSSSDYTAQDELTQGGTYYIGDLVSLFANFTTRAGVPQNANCSILFNDTPLSEKYNENIILINGTAVSLANDFVVNILSIIVDNGTHNITLGGSYYIVENLGSSENAAIKLTNITYDNNTAYINYSYYQDYLMDQLDAVIDWDINFTNTGGIEIGDIAADTNGYLYIVGTYNPKKSANDPTGFIKKVNSLTGNYSWEDAWEDEILLPGIELRDIVVDNDNNIIVTGREDEIGFIAEYSGSTGDPILDQSVSDLELLQTTFGDYGSEESGLLGVIRNEGGSGTTSSGDALAVNKLDNIYYLVGQKSVTDVGSYHDYNQYLGTGADVSNVEAGSGSDDWSDLTVDNQGNIINVGAVRSSNDDWYITKVGVTSVSVDLGGEDRARAVVTDSNNDIIAAGYCNNTFACIRKFNGSDLTLLNDTDDINITMNISDHINFTGFDDIAIDSKDNVYATAATNKGFFVVEFNSSGAQIWNRTINWTEWNTTGAVPQSTQSRVSATGTLNFDQTNEEDIDISFADSNVNIGDYKLGIKNKDETCWAAGFIWIPAPGFPIPYVFTYNCGRGEFNDVSVSGNSLTSDGEASVLRAIAIPFLWYASGTWSFYGVHLSYHHWSADFRASIYPSLPKTIVEVDSNDNPIFAVSADPFEDNITRIIKYEGGFYYYNRTFDAPGNYTYDITCDSVDYEGAEDDAWVLISPREATYGIYEPLCCAGGTKTGQQCIDDGHYNPTSGTGDIYCEGQYAGQDITLNLLHTFEINLQGLTMSSTDVLECIAEYSNGSLFVINETGLILDNENYDLNYTLSTNDNIIRDTGTASIHDVPWYLHNCSIKDNESNILRTFAFNNRIYVHKNTDWTAFDFQKAVFAESVPFKFFNNTAVPNVTFIINEDKSAERNLAFQKYAGAQTEEYCYDSIDNDGDGDTDGDDWDCRTFLYNYITPEFYNSYDYSTRSNSITGMSVGTMSTSADSDNLIINSVGSRPTNYWYAVNTDPSGTFKIRIFESPGSNGYGYTIKNVPNVGNINVIGNNINGILSKSCSGGLCNVNYDCSGCGSSVVDAVIEMNFTNTGMDGSYTLTIEVVHGTVVESETFTIYLDPSQGLSNNDESETSSGVTATNMCNDSISNDLDISTDYTYINGLGPYSRVSYSRDCADIDCVGLQGPSYTAEQYMTFSQGLCEYKTELNCSDGYDNDFNDDYATDAYGISGTSPYTDCHDIDCFGTGGAVSTTNPCPAYENNTALWCFDGQNNDWDYAENYTVSYNSSYSNPPYSETLERIENYGVSPYNSLNGRKWNHSEINNQLTNCMDVDCNNTVNPGNSSEKCEWGHELTCSDGFDNDVLGLKDCELGSSVNNRTKAPSFNQDAEYDCASYCRTNNDNDETGDECINGIDNDWDFWSVNYSLGLPNHLYEGSINWSGGIDCRWLAYNPDDNCNMTLINVSGSIWSQTQSHPDIVQCQLGTELNCTDNFDNDIDRDNSGAASSGWAGNSDGYKVYNEDADCADYDCYTVIDSAGNYVDTQLGNTYACPTNEYTKVNGDNADANASWCFDGIDNDLDGLDDCNDPDCLNVVNPADPTQRCAPYEFNSTALTLEGFAPNYCGDLKDNEGRDTDNYNSTTTSFNRNSLGLTYNYSEGNYPDCIDLDCFRQFGSCAPCSENEFVYWNSCFDTYDNDHDGNSDLYDADCSNKLRDREGNLQGETIAEICSNFYDDDHNGSIDCRDDSCTGHQFSPDGRTCGANQGTESACNDDYDNDNDNSLDCYDSDCNITCGIINFAGEGILYNPRNSSFSMTGSTTINGVASTIIRKGGDLYVRYYWSGTAGAPTIYLGALISGYDIPLNDFDAANAQFIIQDGFTKADTSSGGLGQLKFTKSSVSSFDFTIRIPGKNTLLNLTTIRSTASIGTLTSQGDFNVEIVNNVNPSFSVIKLEPNQGKLTRDDNLYVIGGNFTGYSGGQTHSGRAGRCYINITGPAGFSETAYANNCNHSVSITRSGTYDIEITAYDSTGLAGNTLSDSITLYVAPKIYQQISDFDMVWYKNESSFDSVESGITALFKTSENESYDSNSCKATYRNESGAIISVETINATLSDGGSTITCEINGTLPYEIINNDGVYSVTINVTESTRGYSLETKKHIFYVCNDLSSAGSGWNCSYADFDQDGYTEGVLSKYTYDAGLYEVYCDNCPEDYNPDQIDSDGDGLGDICDGLEVHIYNINHTAAGVLNPTDSFTVTMNATVGATATFDINALQTGIPLYDDGAHGDGDANDGIYSNTYYVSRSFIGNFTIIGHVIRFGQTDAMNATPDIEIQAGKQDIALLNMDVSEPRISGQNIDVNLTLKNIGTANETNITVNLTIADCLDGEPVCTETELNSTLINLSKEETKIVGLSFTTAQTGWKFIFAEAVPLPYEDHRDDNLKKELIELKSDIDGKLAVEFIPHSNTPFEGFPATAPPDWYHPFPWSPSYPINITKITNYDSADHNVSIYLTTSPPVPAGNGDGNNSFNLTYTGPENYTVSALSSIVIYWPYNITFPEQEGNYTLYVNLTSPDFSGQVTDVHEIEMKNPSSPQLLVSLSANVSLNSAIVNDSINLSADIENQGNEDAINVTVDLDLSSALSTASPMQVNFTNISAPNYSLPPWIPQSNYNKTNWTLIVEDDDYQWLTVTSNCSTAGCYYHAYLPDPKEYYLVSSISVPEIVFTGTPYLVNATIENKGLAEAENTLAQINLDSNYFTNLSAKTVYVNISTLSTEIVQFNVEPDSPGIDLSHTVEVYKNPDYYYSETNYLDVIGPDATPPVIEFLEDIPDITNQYNLRIYGRINDPYGSANLTFDGSEEVLTLTPVQGYAYFDVTKTLSLGGHTLSITAFDYWGNNATIERNVTYDPMWNYTTPYPEGVYELSGIYPYAVTRDTFYIYFKNQTRDTDIKFECNIYKSNGTLFTLNKTLTQNITNEDVFLDYTIQSGDPTGAYNSTWFVENCTIYNSTGGIVETNTTKWPIYIKTENWYFNVAGLRDSNDAANAFLAKPQPGIPSTRSYFGHNDTTNYDINYAVKKMIESDTFEGICHDKIDNDNDGFTDCDDDDCLTVFEHYLCGHNFTEGGFGQFSENSVTGAAAGDYETKDVTTGTCQNNICRYTYGTIDVKYTQTVSTTGDIKVTYYKTSGVNNKQVILRLGNMTDLGITDTSTSLYGPNQLPYKQFIPSTPPYTVLVATSKLNEQDTGLYSGSSLNMGMNHSLNGTQSAGDYVLPLSVWISGDKGTNNLNIEVQSSGAPENLEENDSNLPHNPSSFISGIQKTSDESCNDDIDNDLNIVDGKDCADSDCEGRQIGVTSNGDPIRCEIPETTCWDGFDNDNDGLVDCADSDCSGKIGAYYSGSTPVKYYTGSANVAMCEYGSTAEGTINYTSTPSSCSDSFDNDADRASYGTNIACDGTYAGCRGTNIDCFDAYSCWGRSGTNTGICPLRENSSALCQDNIDNDYDVDLQGGSANWQSILIPDPGLDSTGADCDDYDCYGLASCPTNESTDAAWCFDNIDNDLDAYYWNVNNYTANSSTGKDCADPDCSGVVNPENPILACLASEFSLGVYDLCRDSIDNDWDSRTDCIDNLNPTDCWHTYQYCGPCPAYENYTYDSCADNIDNDYDNGAGGYETSINGYNCQDSDCLNELGSYSGAFCDSTENTQEECSDEIDNDAAGGTDCADDNCDGISVTGGTCRDNEDNTADCNDDFDNDGDSNLDCLDSQCYGIGSCHTLDWSTAGLTIVPHTTGTLTTDNGNARFYYTDEVHRGEDNFQIRVWSNIDTTGKAVQIALGTGGDNVAFNVNANQIILDSGSDTFTKVWSNNILTLTQTGGGDGSYDVTITIPVPSGTAAGAETFQLTTLIDQIGKELVSVNVRESGDPVISEIEIEPNPSLAVIEYGDPVGIRAIPTDAATGGSAIYSCNFVLDSGSVNTETDCIYNPVFYSDGSHTVYVNATDQYNNIGAANSQSFTVDVKPAEITSTYKLSRAFYNSANYTILNIGSFEFVTGQTDSFDSAYDIIIENGSKQAVYTESRSGSFTNIAAISGTVDLPSNITLNDGIYFVRVNLTDNDGYSILSKRKTFFVCNSLTSSGTTIDGGKWSCAKADLDNDGWTEGINTTLYSALPTGVIACDSCPSQLNSGLDSDGDGYDNVCDPDADTLVISDDTDTQTKYTNDAVKFYADYSDYSGNAITGAYCAIFFDDSNSTMQYNSISQLYEYTRQFSSAGTYNWNVTCAKLGSYTLTEDDTATINSAAGAPSGAPSAAARGGGITPSICVEKWECTEWEPCLPNGLQYRECYDLNRCEDLYTERLVVNVREAVEPIYIRNCIYEPKCDDGILNGDESDVDCGGPLCPKCPEGKICNNDNDCSYKCDLTIRRCVTEVVAAPPTIEEPFESRLIPILILTSAVIVLAIAALAAYKYGLIHRGIEHYKSRRAVSRRLNTIKMKKLEKRRRSRLAKKRAELKKRFKK